MNNRSNYNTQEECTIKIGLKVSFLNIASGKFFLLAVDLYMVTFFLLVMLYIGVQIYAIFQVVLCSFPKTNFWFLFSHQNSADSASQGSHHQRVCQKEKPHHQLIEVSSQIARATSRKKNIQSFMDFYDKSDVYIAQTVSNVPSLLPCSLHHFHNHFFRFFPHQGLIYSTGSTLKLLFPQYLLQYVK